MATTIVVSMICLAIGFGIAWRMLTNRLAAVQRELQAAQEESATHQRPEVRDLLQEILDVASRMDRDVGQHTHQLTEVNKGIQQSLSQPASPIVNFTQQLLDANLKLRGDLQAARDEIRSKQSELDVFVNEARTDTLTGLKNRRSFDEELNRCFAQRQRQGTVFSLILLDIDHFKKFNDVFGHLSGDLVLRSVAQLLTVTLRQMDVVCRYGGEEFAVICPGSRLHEAKVAAERIRQAVAAKTVFLKEGTAQVTVSLGAAEVGEAEIAEGLIQRADDALYAAKRAGRNRVHWHDGQECVPAPAETH